MKKVIFLLTFSNSIFLYSNALPFVRIMFDANLGFAFGLGGSYYLNIEERDDIFGGPFFMYSFSKKGNNISIGYTSNWLLTMAGGIAINRMQIDSNNEKKVYWGVESDYTIFFPYGKIGIMKKNKTKFNSIKNYKINISAGLAVPQIALVKSVGDFKK